MTIANMAKIKPGWINLKTKISALFCVVWIITSNSLFRHNKYLFFIHCTCSIVKVLVNLHHLINHSFALTGLQITTPPLANGSNFICEWQKLKDLITHMASKNFVELFQLWLKFKTQLLTFTFVFTICFRLNIF